MLITTPDWLDRQEYPFRSRYLELDGGRMHYIDEGHGQAIVMVHGNPDCSFTYRHLIKRLSGQFRCIAADHIGFGLSDKPTTKAPLPPDHARNLCELLGRLDLGDITLVVNDWGGPIALPFAVAHPERIKRLVIINSSFWSVGRWEIGPRLFSFVMGGPIGRLLIRRYHFLVNVVMKKLVQDPACKTDAIWLHYRMPAANPAHRLASASLPKQIVASGPWFDPHWQQRDKVIDTPTLIIWGKEDPVMPGTAEAELKRCFRNHRSLSLPGVGHYPHEERPEEVASALESFMRET